MINRRHSIILCGLALAAFAIAAQPVAAQPLGSKPEPNSTHLVAQLVNPQPQMVAQLVHAGPHLTARLVGSQAQLVARLVNPQAQLVARLVNPQAQLVAQLASPYPLLVAHLVNRQPQLTAHLIKTRSVAGHLAAHPLSRLSPTVPCRAGVLSARAGWQGATGSLLGSLVLTNRSSQACTVWGGPGAIPHVLLIDAKGRVLPVVNQSEQSIHSLAILILTVQPGKSVRSMIQWRNWCHPRRGTISVQVALPGGGGRLTVPVRDPRGRLMTDTPRCDSPASPSTLQVGSFESLTH